jgi:hypothetical protein
VTSVVPGDVTTPTSGCTASYVTFTPVTPLPSAISPGATATVNGTVAMSASAESACQGATFTIPLTVNGRLG